MGRCFIKKVGFLWGKRKTQLHFSKYMLLRFPLLRHLSRRAVAFFDDTNAKGAREKAPTHKSGGRGVLRTAVMLSGMGERGYGRGRQEAGKQRRGMTRGLCHDEL